MTVRYPTINGVSPLAVERLSFVDVIEQVTEGARRGAWVRPVGWKGRALQVVGGRLFAVPASASGGAEPFAPSVDEVRAAWEVVSESVVMGEAP